MKKIGLLGCGVMGTQIAQAIDQGRIPGATLTHIYDQLTDASNLLQSKLQSPPEITQNAALLASSSVDLIVEAASQDAIRDNALSILQNKKDLMIMSVGALLDESIFEIISEGCKDYAKKVYLPSGAIAGLDGLKSVKDEIDSITLVTTKNPDSFKGNKYLETIHIIEWNKIKEPFTLFEGTASDAVKLFPANINVAALLSLVGLGGNKTKVKVIADPNTNTNTHHIEASGKFGKMSFTIQNVPDSNNPKTSHLAILSAIQRLKSICVDDVQIGT